MLTGNYWKYGLALGAGVALGAIGAVLLSRNGVAVKKSFASLLSHGLDVKEKAAEIMETAKENIDDLAAEAKHAREQRRKARGQSS
ncbi:MAG: hypothetical protein LBQ51_09405 [Desulfovibrio sp.]|jgi:hypothetical protein|nr:hypothetical protein [Desulfovibrio sp.]